MFCVCAIAIALAIQPPEIEAACLMTIRSIRMDVDGDERLTCEISKTVTVTLDDDSVHKVDCSKFCKEGK